MAILMTRVAKLTMSVLWSGELKRTTYWIKASVCAITNLENNFNIQFTYIVYNFNNLVLLVLEKSEDLTEFENLVPIIS